MSETNMTPDEVLASPHQGVGLGATLLYPQDAYGLVVVGVSATAKVLRVKALKSVSNATGHKPHHMEGPWPVWRHEYTEQELKDMAESEIERINWSARKRCYTRGGVTPVTVGKAVYYRNFSY